MEWLDKRHISILSTLYLGFYNFSRFLFGLVKECSWVLTLLLTLHKVQWHTYGVTRRKASAYLQNMLYAGTLAFSWSSSMRVCWVFCGVLLYWDLLLQAFAQLVFNRLYMDTWEFTQNNCTRAHWLSRGAMYWDLLS